MSWHTSHDPARAGLKVALWPPSCRAQWEKATSNRRSKLFQEGHCLSRPTVLKAEKGLRRILGYAVRTGAIRQIRSFLDLLTPELLDGFFAHLEACGNSDRSKVGRFEELECAFHLMYPDRDFGWLTKPDGILLSKNLEMRTKPRFVPSSAVLLDWALELYQCGVKKRDRQIRWAQVRDGLMIALLATDGPRLRALSSLELDKHLIRDVNGWRLAQDAAITKTRNELELPLALEVSEMADRYVACERAEMLRGQFSTAFWISWYGRPLRSTSISGLIWRRSMERFGIGFGPHRFRHSLTTTSLTENPSAPLDPAAILGHGAAVSLRHYNRSKALAAGQRNNERLHVLRKKTADLANRAFAGKEKSLLDAKLFLGAFTYFPLSF